MTKEEKELFPNRQACGKWRVWRLCEGEFVWEVHPGRLTWNLQITHLERKMIFQTSMIMFHVNLPGCSAETFLFFFSMGLGVDEKLICEQLDEEFTGTSRWCRVEGG